MGLIGATLVVAVLAGAETAQAPPIGVNALEEVYAELALRLARLSGVGDRFAQPLETLPPALILCEKIHPDAAELRVAFGGFESWAYSYKQSECFHDVALATSSLELCDRVRTLEGPPPRALLPAGRERRITADGCRRAIAAGNDGGGYAEFGNELLLRLLGYSSAQITTLARGRLPEHDGATDAIHALLDVYDGDEEGVERGRDFLSRLSRLPDFTLDDAEARQQVEKLAPGWSSPSNTSRLAEALRCAVPRRAPGAGLSNACLGRM
jgi:hypothetical protein